MSADTSMMNRHLLLQLGDRLRDLRKDQRRRRWSVQEKAALVRRTYEPGMSVSLVARQEGALTIKVLWPMDATAELTLTQP